MASFVPGSTPADAGASSPATAALAGVGPSGVGLGSSSSKSSEPSQGKKPSLASLSSSSAPGAEAWDPLHPGNLNDRIPTVECRKRIRRDMRSLQEDPLPSIFCVRDETYLTVLHALITGPFETPYEGGFFWFVLNCPDDYPNRPPKVKLMTTGGGAVRFNPNLYANGKVCLSILGTWSGPGWSPVQSLSSVLLSIQSLMNPKPYHNEPGYEVAKDHRAVDKYNDYIQYQTLRVAVYDMVKNQLGPESCMPEALKFIVRNLFPSMYDGFVITCDTCIGRGFDGTALHDPFSRPQHDTMQYCKLKELIVELKLQCDRDDEEQDALDEQAQGATARSATSGAEEAGLAAASQSPAPVEPHSPSSSLFTNVPAAAGAEESGASNSNTG
uniref:Ubiquitin-conjugating enzyme E2 Z n=1 Tax=Rhizochromulina marina TaxID=1034831 RepID=A0A7S2RPK1_9STRA